MYIYMYTDIWNTVCHLNKKEDWQGTLQMEK